MNQQPIAQAADRAENRSRGETTMRRRRADLAEASLVPLVAACAALATVGTPATSAGAEWISVTLLLLVPAATAYLFVRARAGLGVAPWQFIRWHFPAAAPDLQAARTIVTLSVARLTGVATALFTWLLAPGRALSSISLGVLLAVSGLFLLTARTYDPRRNKPHRRRRLRNWHHSWFAAGAGVAFVFGAASRECRDLDLGTHHVVLVVVFVRLVVAVASGMLDAPRVAYLGALVTHTAALGALLYADPGIQQVIYAAL